MSFFEGQGVNWSQHRHQQSWDQSQNSAQHGPGPQREDNGAFGAQFEEVARASENLSKSSKVFGSGRRESMPPGAFSRQFPEYGSAGVQRHSAAEFDSIRPTSSSSLSGYLANQRFGSRPSEAEQMMQVKRRAAAQRERELRNYHQEQQYNRHLSGAKSERAMSPSAMSEEDRRELIARQHRALYGNDSNLYLGENPPARPLSQDARVTGANGQGAGAGPFDQFGMSTASSVDNNTPVPASNEVRSRAESTASPSPNPNSFAMFDGVQQPSRASTSSPNGASPPRQGMKAGSTNGVAPIGTRPIQASGQLKRSTPPTSSPLSYGFSNDKAIAAERSTSAASNPPSGAPDKSLALGWGSTSGAWSATKNTMGVQASVWG